MSYASGGLIEATDYNGLASTNSANVAWVWGTGFGDTGYGQSTTPIASVSSSATVTAAQWQGLFNIVNRTLGHQSGAAARLAGGGNINVVGDTITYFSNVATAVTTINTNKALFDSQGSSTALTANTWVSSAATGAAYTQWIDVNVTWSSANQARYFFNAGGQLNITWSATSSQNNSRSNNLAALINQIGGVTAFRNTTNGGRVGSGGTLTTNNTSFGYRNAIFNNPTTIFQVSSGAPYGSDTAVLQVFGNANDPGSQGAITSSLAFRCYASSAADDVWNNAIGLSIATQVTVVYPETTYLTDSWGTVTDSRDNG